MNDSKYIVFRVYPEDKDRGRFYGWTSSKSVAKGFTKQRSREKYKVFKVLNDDIERYENANDTGIGGIEISREYMIDFVKLLSQSDRKPYIIFTTLSELREFEISIRGLFKDLSSVSTIDGDYKYLNMLHNLQDRYSNALETIGYRPPEMDSLYDSNSEDAYRLEDVEDMVNNAYDDASSLRQSEYSIHNELPGRSYMNDIFNLVIYSLESFIRVMKNEM